MGMNIPKIGRTITAAALGAGLLFLLQMFAATPESTALDNPHIPNNLVNCSNCHSSTAAKDFVNQGDQTNGVCGQCHNPSLIATNVKPHVSTQWGTITIQCSECHNPHYQRQSRFYKDPSYAATGAITAVTAITVTLSAPLPAPPTGTAWTDYFILPNKSYTTFIYKIGAYDGNVTITINTGKNGLETINTTYIKPGAAYAIVYGKLVKEYVRGREVRFFKPWGTNSFADTTPIVDGVCQVCHTQTHSFTNSGALEHPTQHPQNEAGKACASCHDHNSASGGFLPSCNSCHGSPPVSNATLITKDKNSVSVTSDSPTIPFNNGGSHAKHIAVNLACANCHSGGMLGGSSQGDNLINIGFTLNSANLVATYDGKPGRTVFPYAGWGSTTVTTGNTLQCTNLYCHSTGQSTTNASDPTPAYAFPVWTSSGTGACGTCHKVTEASGLTSGSHGQHLGTAGVNGCGDCHTGAANDASSYNSANHVNKSIDAANSYTAGGAPGNGYGICSTASCHDNGTGTVVLTPIWSTSITDCSECHARQPATASHTKHLTGLSAGFNRNAACGDCHKNAVEATTPPAGHLDGNLDVYWSTVWDLGYPPDVAKGGAPYDSCSTAWCHSNGLAVYRSVTWGTVSTGCNFCHSSLPASGAHAKHVTTAATAYGGTSAQTAGGAYDFGCGNCHPKATSNHMNGTVDIVLNDGVALDPLKDLNDPTANRTGTGNTSVCNKVYCHSNGTTAGLATAASPQWGNTPYPGDSCAMCHGNQPNTGSHSVHVVGIHYNNVFNGITGTGLVASSGTVGSGAGHGDPNTATTINCNLCHNNTVDVAYNAKNSVCLSCHSDTNTPATGNESAAIKALSDTHLNGSVDVTLATLTNTLRSKAQLRTAPVGVWTRSAGYKSAASDYDNATMAPTDWTLATKTCATACHNSQSITWGESNVTCSNCHKGL